MNGYDVAAWTDFAVAATVAAAVLTGLVFVAVSINLRVVLERGSLHGRAAQTVGLLVCLTIVGLCILVPGQTATALGLELIGAGGALGLATVIWAATTQWPDHEPAVRRWLAQLLVLVPVALLLVGGTSVAVGSFGGLYWVFAAVVVGLAAAVLKAWVLLVEINR